MFHEIWTVDLTWWSASCIKNIDECVSVNLLQNHVQNELILIVHSKALNRTHRLIE